MTSSEIRIRFLEFFKKRGHSVIPSASLVTSDEKGITNPTLFNTAGMQPLIPYLLGKPYIDPATGKVVKRLADVQKCLRTVDIDDIGDKTHVTFFEMLGNWSLGDYFKKEAINWSYELLTSKSDVPGDCGFGLDPTRLYVTVFEGDANAKRDDEAADIWRDVFKKNGVKDTEGDTMNGQAGRIFFMPAGMNWWEAGENGPCGPDTEMYYDIGNKFGGKGLTREQFIEADSKRDVVEVWNDVFMQYEKKDGKIIGNLPKPSVDTGAGLERLAMALATPPVDNIYDTDLLKPVMDKIKEFSKNWDLKSARVVADHIRASTFIIADGVLPSNTDRGYVLRKLIRRAVFKMKVIMLDPLIGTQIIEQYLDQYSRVYQDINVEKVREVFRDEELRFLKTLTEGMKELEKVIKVTINGSTIVKDLRPDAVFSLYATYGLPIDLIKELAKSKGLGVDEFAFERDLQKHQALSRTGAEQKFKGGLADANDPMVVRYHTATHLLHQALHDILGDGVMQKGSNITPERLRFDFAHGAKMTDEEKKKVEDIVNEKIAAALPMSQLIMPRALAEKTGARHFFGEKYGDEISIYFVGPASNPPVVGDLAAAYSKEFCGGPHVTNTSELAGPEGKWRFKIQKEEAVAQGVRRIKAILA